MSLTLILEHAPHPQRETSRSFAGGELSIGRGDDADWQLDDPDKYVSRRHCVITGEDGAFSVTDASSGGLFIDGADRPLGTGNTARLEDGMRLRLGDFVMRVELTAAASTGAEEPPRGADFSFSFGEAKPYAPPPERPADLPPPFESTQRRSGHARPETPAQERAGLAFESPFDLPPRKAEAEPPRHEAPPKQTGGGMFTSFELPQREGPAAEEPARQRERPPQAERGTAKPGGFSFSFGTPERATEVTHDEVQKDTPPPRETPPERPAPPPPAAVSDSALRAAFFRGLGVAPPEGVDAEAEMEALGQRFRELTEGLMHLLRARAREKQNVRVAQTVIGASDVNPLKFVASTAEGVEALVEPKGEGYLPPDLAIAGAYRDLADHQMRTWVALQSALRRMIDRFDPAEIEREMQDMGLMEKLLSGGRSAKLWQLYEERYREIAKSAEDRFLGEVGADFRDAYEDNNGS